MPCIMAVPSMLTVAPSGTVKEAMELWAPTRFLATFNVIGIVALLDEVLKAKSIAGRIFLKRVSGFNRVNIVKIVV